MNLSKKDQLFLLDQAKESFELSRRMLDTANNLFKLIGTIAANTSTFHIDAYHTELGPEDIEHQTRILNNLNCKEVDIYREKFSNNLESDIISTTNRTCECVNNNNSDEENIAMHTHVTHGKLRKRNDGRWEIRTTLNGIRITTAIGKVQADVIRLHKEFLETNLIDTPKKSHTLRFYDWLDKWLALKKPNVAKSTWTGNEVIIRLHIKPNIENMSISKIRSMDITALLNKLTTPRNKEDTYKVLSEAFRVAEENKLVKENPCKYLKAPVAERDKGIALTNEQVKLFIDCCTVNSRFTHIYKFMLLSGCRPDEALRMKWTFIDRAAGRMHIDGTKTKKSKRYIPLFDELKKLLDGFAPNDKEHIFGISYSVLQNDFENVRRHLNFYFSLKDLRHTFATRCYEQGIGLKTIQKWLGHTKVETTEKIYVDVLSEQEAREALKISKYF